MARRVIGTDKLVVYKHHQGKLTICPYAGKIEIETQDYEGFACTPAQARYIANRLMQFADDIDKEKK